MHTQFEDLCVTAVSGEITDSERALLDSHMRECEDCRSFIENLKPELSRMAPTVAQLLMVPAEPPVGMRERFLDRAKVAGMTLDVGEPVADSLPTPPLPYRPSFLTTLRGALDASFSTLGLGSLALTGALCAVAASFWIGRHTLAPALNLHTETASISQPLEVPTTKLSIVPAPVAAPDPHIKTDLLATQARLESVTAELATLKAQNSQLEQAAQAATASDQARNLDTATQHTLAEASKSRIVDLEKQVEDLNSKAVMLETVAAAQEKLTIEAQGKLANLRADADRIYAARGTAETMISSRNLHIVDVFDTSGNNKRQRAFGRVFFVEGKSLVFYAYDLPNNAKNKNVSFQFWGESSGTEPATFRLGLMHPDTTGAGRWVVSCDDPKVLGQLRAVYIAPMTRSGEPPSEKMMYALLGSANHP